MRPLILTDLDDTLFQTARKMPRGYGRGKGHVLSERWERERPGQ
jgi:hypothetical protein